MGEARRGRKQKRTGFGEAFVPSSAKLLRVVDGGERPLRRAAAEELHAALGELFDNPLHSLDAVDGILKHELHRLLVDGTSTDASSASAGPRRSGPEAL